jgi:hypothetical protein
MKSLKNVWNIIVNSVVNSYLPEKEKVLVLTEEMLVKPKAKTPKYLSGQGQKKKMKIKAPTKRK